MQLFILTVPLQLKAQQWKYEFRFFCSFVIKHPTGIDPFRSKVNQIMQVFHLFFFLFVLFTVVRWRFLLTVQHIHSCNLSFINSWFNWKYRKSFVVDEWQWMQKPIYRYKSHHTQIRYCLIDFNLDSVLISFFCFCLVSEEFVIVIILSHLLVKKRTNITAVMISFRW